MSRSLLVFFASLAAAALFALARALLSPPTAYFFYYTLPIAVPFAAFVLERALQRAPLRARALDAAVIALALTRAFYLLPFVSGHVLFAAYALATGRSWPVRWTAGLVLVEVLVIKLLVWSDFSTPAGALVIALAAAVAHRRVDGDVRKPRATPDRAS